MYFKYKDKKIKSGGESLICGIINVTPDSFSDGGKYFSIEKALKRADQLVEEGAHCLDIGGESTRPGSKYVQIEEEIERVIPVIQGIKEKHDVIISIDTWKAPVAKAAIDAGADIVNDITGLLGDSDMAKTVADTKAGLVLMFNPVIARPDHPSAKIFPKFGDEDPFTEKERAGFQDIISIMNLYFDKAMERAKNVGIEKERIMLDPGIGFGLTKKENLQLIDQIDVIRDRGVFTYLGVSRKRFIVNIVDEAGFNIDFDTKEGRENREVSGAFLTAIAAYKGVEAFRVHTVKEHKMACAIADTLRLADNSKDLNFKAYD